jgi:hypothetical protein
MAKTFGTGADPKGLVNRGVEGSGAAQIFRPSQAVQDFVTGQRQQGLQKQKQKQAEAKAKAEKQKEIDKYAIDVTVETFMKPDNDLGLSEFNKLQAKMAELKTLGINPRDDPDFQAQEFAFRQLMNNIKNDKDTYRAGVANFAAISKDPNYDPEEVAKYGESLDNFAMAGVGNRKPEDIMPIQKPLDWMKGLETFTAKTKADFISEEFDDITISKKLTPEERINTRFETFKNTPTYKAAIKAGETDESLKQFVKDSLPDWFKRQEDENKLKLKINAGSGTWQNDEYKGSVTQYELGDAFNQAELLGEKSTDAIDMFGLRNATPDWRKEKINTIDYSYFKTIKPKPILASLPRIKAIDDEGKSIDINAFRESTINYSPNRVFETKTPGVYYSTGKASITTINPNTKVPETKNISIGFIINDTNKSDFEQQWLPDGVTLENAMQKNFVVGKGGKGRTTTAKTTTQGTAKPTSETTTEKQRKRFNPVTGKIE